MRNALPLFSFTHTLGLARIDVFSPSLASFHLFVLTLHPSTTNQTTHSGAKSNNNKKQKKTNSTPCFCKFSPFPHSIAPKNITIAQIGHRATISDTFSPVLRHFSLENNTNLKLAVTQRQTRRKENGFLCL